MPIPLIIGIAVAVIVTLIVLVAVCLRRVVPTNEVHIVQTSKATKSFGTDTSFGNVYYEWPSWLPRLGIDVRTLPKSNFDISIRDYEAFDKDRLPFVVDITAFFCIKDSNVAAQRIESVEELHNQLNNIIKGSIRAILASFDINDIMLKRSEFGTKFTEEVETQLANWGLTSVKNIELMDIRDSHGSDVIANIMAKKKSHIAMESRKEVAENNKQAIVAETAAKQEADMRKQEAEQAVGERTAEKEKKVGIATQQSLQEVKEQEKLTMAKEVEVVRTKEVGGADIAKQKAIIKAEETKQTSIISAQAAKETDVLKADGERQKTELIATGLLDAKKKESEGIAVEGKAKAEAEQAMQLAPVTAQITLAKEIGGNEGYQNYLITIKKVEASEKIGIEQARSINKADIKIIANGSTISDGVSKVPGIISSQGGMSLASMLEGLGQTDFGKDLINKVTGSTSKSPVSSSTDTKPKK